MSKAKHFLNIEDLGEGELLAIIEESKKFKKTKNYKNQLLQGKKIAMVFTKKSTRTRASFEVGIRELGGEVVFFSNSESQFSRGESILDTLKVLERYFDALVVRSDDYLALEEFSREAKIPIVNALTNYNHPCQAFADYFTILESKGPAKGLKIAYLGDGNNVAVSLAFLAQKLNLSLTIATPDHPAYECPEEVRKKCPKVRFVNDPLLAARDSDVLYTDTWSSMGDEKKIKEVEHALTPFQVNASLVQFAKKDFIFLHCLPAYRGKEVTADIIDGPHSLVFDQAENRLPTQKAILNHLFR